VDSPVLKFVSQLLACPAGFGIILTAWGLAKLRGKQMSWDSVFNLCGVMMFAFFITVTLAALTPFQCLPNPNNQWSLASNPGIICWASDEHIALIGLAVIGIICYPVAILVWATYTTDLSFLVSTT
ncbi:GRM8, partial [Symbiodinium sp. KB8]